MKGKKEIIDVIAQGAEISKKQAELALNTLIGLIGTELQEGEKFALQGIGTFEAVECPEHQDRNPQTGAAITIKAYKKPRFKASKTLKEALN